MDTERWNLDNEKLLELIHETVREWQSAESRFVSEDLEEQNYLRVELLKELYQSLIREAKERDLTLSKEQLINQIIHRHPDDE